MKGMQKIKRGKSFAGVVLYTLKQASHHKQVPSVIGGNMMGGFAEDLIAEFNTTKKLRPEVEKPVWHNSLRLPKKENLTDAQWVAIADDYMQRMGFSEMHLRCYVMHDDEVGQHIHIIASRIDMAGGNLYLGRNENLISTRLIQEIEKDHSLTITKGLEITSTLTYPTLKPKRKKSRNEAMLEERTGEQCAKSIIQEAIDEITATPVGFHEFIDALLAKNITAKANIASTGKMNGFSFMYAGITFKASQLGKQYGWKNLQLRLTHSHASDIPAQKLYNDVASPLLSPAPEVDLGVEIKAGAGDYKEHLEIPKRNVIDLSIRWLETIPYVDLILSRLKKLKIVILKRPTAHTKITRAKIIDLNFPVSSPPIDVLENTKSRLKI